MSATFPKASGPGYDVHDVEEFLERARTSYAAPAGTPGALTASDIRATAFRMRRGGYQPDAVDAALERLEDAFAKRERGVQVETVGEGAWYSRARSIAQEILDRAARPEGAKFRRVGPLTQGYHPADVDAFAERLIGYFQHGRTLDVTEVRTAVFRPKRGGYDEQQVDLLLDTVTDVMLAVR